MALKLPRPVTFIGACYLCALAFFAPSKFDKIEKDDAEKIESDPNVTAPRILAVRRAFVGSLVLVVISSVIGVAFGYASCKVVGKSEFWIGFLQISGAGLLLWATLAVRGWEVQTFANTTLTERVNQWLFRSLYCIGTALLVLTVAWGNCP
jgi:hypothetical protein